MSGQLHAQAAVHRGKSPRYPSDGKLVGLQRRSGHGNEKIIIIIIVSAAVIIGQVTCSSNTEI
jgi:hypothetical protein